MRIGSPEPPTWTAFQIARGAQRDPDETLPIAIDGEMWVTAAKRDEQSFVRTIARIRAT
jgi:hypothetical protein